MVEKLLVRAAREVQLLAATSPVGAAAERARLVHELRAGRAATPRWTYAPVAHDELRRGLDAAERVLAAEARTPLVTAHLDRVRELAVEAALCAATGTPAVAGLASERFAAPGPHVQREVTSTCASWLAEPAPDVEVQLPSDSPDPRSLLSRMRAEVGRHHLPFKVVVQPSLAPLAATGEQVILVAPGRPTSEQDVARTVLHEIEGHVRPRVRAQAAPLVLLRVGTARGIDHQEGRALLLEDRASLLGPRRRRQLAARHRAVEAMLGGCTWSRSCGCARTWPRGRRTSGSWRRGRCRWRRSRRSRSSSRSVRASARPEPRHGKHTVCGAPVPPACCTLLHVYPARHWGSAGLHTSRQ